MQHYKKSHYCHLDFLAQPQNLTELIQEWIHLQKVRKILAWLDLRNSIFKTAHADSSNILS